MEITSPTIAPPNRKPLEPVWRAGAALADDAFARIRRRALLEFCKWDAQIGDVCTLANFPLIISAATWHELATLAEALTVEALAAETEMLDRPELLTRIGLPRKILKAFADYSRLGPTATAARTMRFDFHLTTDGWQISEVNSDVPGGFAEASSFTRMMATHYPHLAMASDPISAWCQSLDKAQGGQRVAALLTAPGFMEDHQIMAYLAGQLQSMGWRTCLANPLQLSWRDGRATLKCARHDGSVDIIVRFYQGEWIANLPASCDWEYFFRGGRTPVGNPGSAIIPESKRFPLAWEHLSTDLSTWRRLLPETRDPREAPWQTDDDWLVKSALCNTGDTVAIRGLLNAQQWRLAAREVRRAPDQWVAQRRFEPVPLATPQGEMYPCIGVYTIDGQAAGAYARIAPRPLIDFAAIDIAVLVDRAGLEET